MRRTMINGDSALNSRADLKVNSKRSSDARGDARNNDRLTSAEKTELIR
jgi:hypothetical protein